MVWARKLTNKANDIANGMLRLWCHTYSPGNGMLIWTTTGKQWSDLEDLNDPMGADEEFLALVAQGVNYTADSDSATDFVYRITYTPDDFDVDAWAFAVAWTVVALPGQFGRASALGAETAQRITAVTGAPTTFAVNQTGPQRMFEWKSYYGSISAVDKGTTLLGTDAGFTELVDFQLSEIYTPGAVRVLRRVR